MAFKAFGLIIAVCTHPVFVTTNEPNYVQTEFIGDYEMFLIDTYLEVNVPAGKS